MGSFYTTGIYDKKKFHWFPDKNYTFPGQLFQHQNDNGNK